MKQRWSGGWFRIFALCLSIGLGAAFVWSQQQKAVTGKSGAVPETGSPLTPDGNQPNGEDPLMPGSKSITGIIEWSPVKPEDPTLLPDWKQMEKVDRTLMHGSKSAIIVEPKDRVMLPGSKSLIIPPQKSPKTEP